MWSLLKATSTALWSPFTAVTSRSSSSSSTIEESTCMKPSSSRARSPAPATAKTSRTRRSVCSCVWRRNSSQCSSICSWAATTPSTRTIYWPACDCARLTAVRSSCLLWSTRKRVVRFFNRRGLTASWKLSSFCYQMKGSIRSLCKVC